jgi:hypothetical protein
MAHRFGEFQPTNLANDVDKLYGKFFHQMLSFSWRKKFSEIDPHCDGIHGLS